MTQHEKALRLRELHHAPAPLVLPNAWDALSARLFEQAGFPAIATTSAGIAALFGSPDGQRLPPRLMLDMVECIARTVAVPVTADLEAGYGDSPDAVAATVEDALHRGIVGLNIEDGAQRPGHPLVDIHYQTDILRAIREVAVKADIPLVLNARIDVYLSPVIPDDSKFAEALRRAHAYRDAGADCLFVIHLTDPDTIRRLAREAGTLINILHSLRTPSIPELHQLGVSRISFGSAIHYATLPQLRALAADLHLAHTSPLLAQTEFTHASVNALFP